MAEPTFGNAFYLGNGDTVQLSYIAKTLQEKSYIRPGTTTNPEISFPSAETILYWVKAKAKLNTKGVKGEGKVGVLGENDAPTPGSPQGFAEKKLIRKSVSIDKTAQINGVIPGVNISTVSADVVNSYVVEDVINSANEMNREYIKTLVATAKAADEKYEGGAGGSGDVYQSILNLRAEFIEKNKFYGLAPTAMFVSPRVMARLKRENLVLFKDNSPYGTFLDMEIIECVDLPIEGKDGATSTVNAVMLHNSAIISGVAFNAVKTFDAAPLGYTDGVAYIGELCYTHKATEFGDDYDVTVALKF